MLIPATARQWLPLDSRRRSWSNHGAMMIRRREALDALTAAHVSLLRLFLGVLAFALAVGGAAFVGRGIAEGGETQAGSIGIGLLVLGVVLAALLVVTGATLTRAIAQWWSLATEVGADGGRVDATSGPETRRAHESAVSADRASGAGELWRLPLLPRTLAVPVLVITAVVLVVQVLLGMGEATTPFAGGDVRGPWLARIIIAVVCLLTALLVTRGLRRIHRARMHRVDRATGGADRPAAHTPALATGAIVVGGRRPAAGPPPGWSGATGAPPADASPAYPPPNPSAAPAHAPAPVVRLGDGRQLASGITLLGRAPQARPGEHIDAALTVVDDRVSKNHLTVTVGTGTGTGPAATGVVVVDRGSTNGSVVHDADGTSRPLQPGEKYELTEGAVVVFGATTLTVGEPADVEHTVLRVPDGESSPSH